MKICCVMGTRPEIIKLTPIVKRAKLMNIDAHVIHSGQHYDHEMSHVFIEEGNVRPDRFLGVKEETHGRQLSEIIKRLEPVLFEEKPDFCVVEGDTNTTLAAALVTAKNNFRVAHVEAGCRCFLKTPEEINRIIVDDVSDVLFAPSEYAIGNLKREGVRGDIRNVGHIFVEIIKNLKERSLIKHDVGIQKPSEYVLVTCHRSENVDTPEVLKNIIDGLTGLDLKVFFPIHPRTKKMLQHYGTLKRKLNSSHNVHIVPPMGHREFLSFLEGASVVITDSGGVQVEASILKVPCVTIRERTEWMETVKAGFNFIVGTNPSAMKSTVKELVDNNYAKVLKHKPSPFKGENASEKMIKILMRS